MRVEDIRIGMLVCTEKDGCGKAAGERGNWRAEGTTLWRVVGIRYNHRFNSGWCIELFPYDPALSYRKYPLSVDAGLVLPAKLRIEAA